MSQQSKLPLVAAISAGLLASGLIACSPALNWRQVRIQELRAALPCKPEHALRTVNLAGLDVKMEMVGCETATSLFAISYIGMAHPADSARVEEAWRASALLKLHAESVHSESFRSALAPVIQLGAVGPAGATEVVVVKGRSSDGRLVRAYLTWFQKGPAVYHVAAFGTALDSDSVELLFSELRLP